MMEIVVTHRIELADASLNVLASSLAAVLAGTLASPPVGERDSRDGGMRLVFDVVADLLARMPVRADTHLRDGIVAPGATRAEPTVDATQGPLSQIVAGAEAHRAAGIYAAYLGLRRPLNQARAAAAPEPPKPAASASKASTSSPALSPAKPSPRIAAYVPPAKATAPVSPPLTEKQKRQISDRAAIDTHIATRGVTRCPTGVAAPTTAALDPADAEAQRRRSDALREAYLAEGKARGQRVAVNRARKLSGKQPLGVVSPQSAAGSRFTRGV